MAHTEVGMRSQEPLTGVGKTALGVARMRAHESQRPDRLFNDPYAQAFVTAAPETFPDGQAGSGEPASLGAVFAFHTVIRTRFFDDYLLAACTSGCQQVVLLAAGLDTRAFRLAWPPGTGLFELDLPAVLTFKDQVLAGQAAVPQCERTVLPIDLREDWPTPLTKAGFQPARPTAWLVEGLLIYLSADEAAHLLTTVGELSAPHSQIAFEHGNIADSSLLAHARTMPTMDQFTSLWKGGLRQDAPDWLTHHGWQVKTHDHANLATSHGRPVPGHSAGGAVTAERRTAV
jgi:methyltransferase (TIGR00027 family)